MYIVTALHKKFKNNEFKWSPKAKNKTIYNNAKRI